MARSKLDELRFAFLRAQSLDRDSPAGHLKYVVGICSSQTPPWPRADEPGSHTGDPDYPEIQASGTSKHAVVLCNVGARPLHSAARRHGHPDHRQDPGIQAPGAICFRGMASSSDRRPEAFQNMQSAFVIDNIQRLSKLASLDHTRAMEPCPKRSFSASKGVSSAGGILLQAVSNSLWAYAKLSYNPGILMLDVASQKAAGMLHQYTSQELANTVWALGALEHYPGSSMLSSAATQIARRMEQFTPQVRVFFISFQELRVSAIRVCLH